MEFTLDELLNLQGAVITRRMAYEDLITSCKGVVDESMIKTWNEKVDTYMELQNKITKLIVN